MSETKFKFQAGNKVPPGTIFRKDAATDAWFEKYFKPKGFVPPAGAVAEPEDTEPAASPQQIALSLGTPTTPKITLSPKTTKPGIPMSQGYNDWRFKVGQGFLGNGLRFGVAAEEAKRAPENLKSALADQTFDTGSGGRMKLLGGSGNEKLIGTGGDEEKRDPRLAPNIRPMLDAANYIQELLLINKIKKDQLNRRYVPAPFISHAVASIRDFDPAILAAQQHALSQIRSGYAGSDPAMQAIMQNMANANKLKTANDFIAQRAEYLGNERIRKEQGINANIDLAAAAEAKQRDIEQQKIDFELGATNAADEAKKVLNQSFLSALGVNVGNAAQFNLTRQAMVDAAGRQEFEDKLAMIGLLPEGERAAALAELEKSYAQYTRGQIPDFNTASRMWRTTRSQRTAEQNRKAKFIS